MLVYLKMIKKNVFDIFEVQWNQIQLFNHLINTWKIIIITKEPDVRVKVGTWFIIPIQNYLVIIQIIIKVRKSLQYQHYDFWIVHIIYRFFYQCLLRKVKEILLKLHLILVLSKQFDIWLPLSSGPLSIVLRHILCTMKLLMCTTFIVLYYIPILWTNW